MNGNDFSFSLSASPTGSGGADRTRYMAPPYNARLVDPQTVCLLVRGDLQVRELPLSLVQLLSQCGRFLSLDEHARALASAMQQPGSEAQIRQSLRQLVELGLLLSEADVLERLTVQRSERESGAIKTLFIRTCGRPGTLRRLFDSMLRHGLPDGLRDCIVLDDSRDPDARSRTRDLVAEFQPQLSCRLRLVDVDRRRTLLERLAADSGASKDCLMWTIEGDAHDPAPSYGASLNLALLLGAGSRIAIMDDDASFDAFVLPGSTSSPGFRRSQSARLHFPDPAWTLPGNHYAPLETHPLAGHANLLGLTGGELAALAEDDADALLEDLDPQLLHELSGTTRVRLTSSGTLGDPGTASIQWLLGEDPLQLQALCEDEDRYLALIGQRRLARGTCRPEATTAFSLMTTTLTGIDNRELLLPTQARGANEDLLFGALLNFLHPGALQLGLPHMLFHQRPEPRRWRREDFDRPRGIQRGGFIARQVEQLLESGRSLDPERRADLLGAALRDLAGSRELRWLLERELMETRADSIERIEATRRSLKPPPWLDRDFARALSAHRSITDSDHRQLDDLAGQLPDFLERFAASLPHWRLAWRHASSLGPAEMMDDGQ